MSADTLAASTKGPSATPTQPTGSVSSSSSVAASIVTTGSAQSTPQAVINGTGVPGDGSHVDPVACATSCPIGTPSDAVCAGSVVYGSTCLAVCAGNDPRVLRPLGSPDCAMVTSRPPVVTRHKDVPATSTGSGEAGTVPQAKVASAAPSKSALEATQAPQLDNGTAAGLCFLSDGFPC